MITTILKAAHEAAGHFGVKWNFGVKRKEFVITLRWKGNLLTFNNNRVSKLLSKNIGMILKMIF